jgi:hypothetical protein
MKKTMIILTLISLLLTACQTVKAGAKVPTKAIITVTTYNEIESKVSTNREATPAGLAKQAGDAVIIFQRSGGFAGNEQQWYFTASGQITDNKGNQLVVEAAQIKILLDEFKTAGFFDMKDTFGGGKLSNCKDCFTYVITVTLDGQTKTVTTQDGAAGVPEAIWKVIGELNKMITLASQ